MPIWFQISTGPLFHFALVIFILGLTRLVIINIWEMIIAIYRAGDHRLPFAQVMGESLSWLFPIFRLHRTKRVYSYASFGFHFGIIFAPLFLRNHLDILQSNLGISWLTFARPILDILTLVTIFTGVFLLLYRIYIRSSRAMSNIMDYALLLLIINIFISGYVAGRPWNPIPYDQLMLFHTLNGIFLLSLIPFTKISHCVLFPLIRVGSEIAWHLTPQGGIRVVKTLYGSDGRKI